MTQEQRVTIEQLGWGPAFAEPFREYGDAGMAAARVVIEHRGAYVLQGDGEQWAEMSGRLRHLVRSPVDRPAVGDWVAHSADATAERAQIQAVLPRTSVMVRRAAGKQTVEQVIAANVDVLYLVSSLNGDLNPQRMERYLTLAWESGASPVVVLTKADLCADLDSALALVEAVTFGVPMHLTSAPTGQGFEAVREHLGENRTGAAVGSSGVGKSTLINHLLGDERLATRDIRLDGRGRHTTTHRELVVLPGGGCIIDTPGMRELQLWDAADGLERAFEDFEELAAHCRFNDCRHETEPGCAVQAAIAEGKLEPGRLESYRKLQRELAFVQAKDDKRARSEERKRWAAVNKASRTDAY
jgi:ribosome biogenesis GTPase / thiamine phosphate phosphatase